MPILQSASGAMVANGTAFTVSLPQTTQAGSRVVVAIGGNVVVNVPAGFTSRSPQVNNMGHYLMDAAGGASSWNFTTTASGRVGWHVYEVAGGSFDTSVGSFSGAAASGYTAPAITPTSGTRLLIAGFAVGDVSEYKVIGGWGGGFTSTLANQQTLTTPTYYIELDTGTQEITANGSTAYTASITTTGSGGNTASDRSAIVGSYVTSGAPAPATPTGLQATAVRTTEVDLSWNAAADATSYEVVVTGPL